MGDASILGPLFLMWGAVHAVPRKYRLARVCALVGAAVWLGAL